MSSGNRYQDLDQQILGEAMTSDYATGVLRELCDTFGNRFAGSRGEWRAGDFLLGSFQDIGLANVRPEPFPFLAWIRRRRPMLKAVQPRAGRFDSIALPYSPATEDGEIEVELLNLGQGMPEDFERAGEAIRGTAVRVTSASPGYYHRWVHRAEKYALAVQHGAAAFLFVNHYDGLLPPTGSIRFNREAEIPGLGLSKEEGARLARLANQAPVRLAIETFDETASAEGRNVVGEFPGTERPEEVILVGGHYDGHDISQGAEDNGSGVATVLEAARLLARHREALQRTVRFVCFSAEEVGLLGGHAYVEQHADELATLRLMINVDDIGSTRGKGFNAHGWDEAKPLLADLGGEMRLDIGFASRPNAYSDHFPFLIHGVPNFGLGTVGGAPSGRGYGHTAADTFEKVSRADLREAAALLARSLLRFANEPTWALKHKSRAEIKRLLDRYDIRHVLRTEGTLPDPLR